MGHRLNLSHLTEEECEEILKVIQKDFDIRQLEKDRLALIEADLKEEKARVNILANRENFNDKYCLICFKKFLFFFVPKYQCSLCRHCYCKNCISFDVRHKTNICFNCRKHHEFLLQSNPWFYKGLADKFKRCGSAKVIRSLYKRRAESDVKSDSGHRLSIRDNVCPSESKAEHSRPSLSNVFEMEEMHISLQKNDGEEALRSLSFYNQQLEAIKRRLRKAFVESRGCHESGQKSIYEDALNMQLSNISYVLSSLTKDLTSHLSGSANQDHYASKEIISKYVLQQCIDQICVSSPADTDSCHPFGIDPEDLSLQGYIEKLSHAILSKMNVDLKSSEDMIFQQEENEVQKELLRLSNHARIVQMGKELSDSELEDLQITTDSTSDFDSREWQIRNSSDSMSASSLIKHEPSNPLDYDKSECATEENSTFTFSPQKNSTPMLPVLDTNSSLSQPDINPAFEPTQKESSSAEDLQTLHAEGLDTVTSNGIQIAPSVNYSENKCISTETEDVKTFLSKPQSVEEPMINMDIYDSTAKTDGSFGSICDEIHDHHWDASLREEVSGDTANNLAEDSSKAPMLECSPNRIPWFETVPQDVHASIGEEFTCSYKSTGSEPIERTGIDERSVRTTWKEEPAVNRLTKEDLPVDTRELNNMKLPWATAGRANTEDGKDVANPALGVNTSNKQAEDWVSNHQRSEDYHVQLWNQEQTNLSDITSDVLTTNLDTKNEQNISNIPENDHQKSNNREDILYEKQVPVNEEKMPMTRNPENEKNLRSEISSEVAFSKNVSEPGSTEILENSEIPKPIFKSSFTLNTGGQHEQDSSPHNVRKITKKEKANKSPHFSNPFVLNSPLETGDDIKSLSESFQSPPTEQKNLLSESKIFHPRATSHIDDLEMKTGRFDFSEEAKGPESQNSNGTDTQVTVTGLPKTDSKHYSRKYEVHNKHDSPAITNERSKSTERRISTDMVRLTRRRNYSSASESDVFEPDKRANKRVDANGNEDDLTTISQNATPASAKSDLADIDLPSVKMLRMKFNTPRDTSAAEALLRKKNRPKSNVYPDVENKWKSTECVNAPSPSFRIPVSVVPLQPKPINSRSTSQSSISDDNLSPQLKTEAKFQEEVIISQHIVRGHPYSTYKTPSEKSYEEFDRPDLPPASSVSGRISIRPFSQRVDSINSEIGTSNQGSRVQHL